MLRLVDAHSKNTPERCRRVAREIDDVVVVGSAGEHCRIIPARTFVKHRYHEAAMRLQPLALDALVQRKQPRQSLARDRVIDRRTNLWRGRSRPRRILELEQGALTHLLDETHRLGEVVFGLAGKADDD